MQKALENPHYKKIWEKVMMNRHPEVKSLEEALTLESRQYGCMITMITSPLSDTHRKTEVAYILYDDGVDSANNERWYCFKKDTIEPHTFTIVKLQAQIIGRPITLEDILILLSNLENNNKINIEDIDITRKNTYILPEKKRLDNSCVCIDIIKYLEQEDEDEDEERILFYFEITKPLHEQDICVWESISKLID